MLLRGLKTHDHASNLRDDPAELHDLSRQRPEVLAQMLSEWKRYVADNGVIVKAGTAE